MSWFVPDKRDDDGDRSDPKPGFYLAKIANATLKRSQKGDEYGNVLLADANTNKILCYTIFMLEGRGAGIGAAKASKFGLTRAVAEPEEGKEILDIEEWIDAQAVVKLVEEEWNGKIRMVPDEEWGRFGFERAETWDNLKGQTFGGDDPPEDDLDVPF